MQSYQLKTNEPDNLLLISAQLCDYAYDKFSQENKKLATLHKEKNRLMQALREFVRSATYQDYKSLPGKIKKAETDYSSYLDRIKANAINKINSVDFSGNNVGVYKLVFENFASTSALSVNNIANLKKRYAVAEETVNRFFAENEIATEHLQQEIQQQELTIQRPQLEYSFLFWRTNNQALNKALFSEIETGNLKNIQGLLHRGADINTTCAEDKFEGITPLIAAIKCHTLREAKFQAKIQQAMTAGNYKQVMNLLALSPETQESLYIDDCLNKTELEELIKTLPSPETIKTLELLDVLLKYKADINLPTKTLKLTPLHWAARLPMPHIAAFLVANDAKIEKDEMGNYPLGLTPSQDTGKTVAKKPAKK